MGKISSIQNISSQIRDTLDLSEEFSISSLLKDSFTKEEIEQMEIDIDTEKSLFRNIDFIKSDLKEHPKMSEARKNEQNENLKKIEEQIRALNEKKAQVSDRTGRIKVALIEKFSKMEKYNENFPTLKNLNDNLNNIGASYTQNKHAEITGDQVRFLIKKEALKMMEKAIEDLLGDPFVLKNDKHMQNVYKFLNSENETQNQSASRSITQRSQGNRRSQGNQRRPRIQEVSREIIVTMAVLSGIAANIMSLSNDSTGCSLNSTGRSLNSAGWSFNHCSNMNFSPYDISNRYSPYRDIFFMRRNFSHRDRYENGRDESSIDSFNRVINFLRSQSLGGNRSRGGNGTN